MVMSALLELFTECQLRRVNRGFINVLPSKSACTGSQLFFLLLCSLLRTGKSTCTNVPVSFIICSGQLKDFVSLCFASN